MGGGKGAAEKVKIEPESSNKNENHSQDTTEKVRILRTIDDDLKKNQSVNINKGSVGKSLISDEDTLKICRTISVDLIRLPDSIVNKSSSHSPTKSKKKKRILWSKGIVYDYEKQRKRNRERSLQAIGNNAASPRSPEFHIKNANEEAKSNRILNNEIYDKSEVVIREKSSRENVNLPKKSIAAEENIVEKKIAFELPVSETIVAVEVHSAFQHKYDQVNYPEISDEVEIHLPTNNHQDSTNSTVNATEISLNSNLVSTESNNNRNRKTSLRKLQSRCSSTNMESVESRKRIHISNNGDIENLPSHRSKKPKIMDIIEGFEEPMEEISTIELDENAAVIKNKMAIAEINRCNPKFVRRRTRFTENNIFREARVVLCRLENFQDPLVTKWRIKTTLESLNNVVITRCRTVPIIDNIAFDENIESGPVIKDTPIMSLEDLSESSDAIRNIDKTQETLSHVLSSNESESVQLWEKTPLVCEEAGTSSEAESMGEDNDDDEIVNFLHNRRKNRRMIESSSSNESSSSDDTISTHSYLEQTFGHQTARKTPLLRSHVKAALAESSTSESVDKEIPKTSRLPVEEVHRASSPRKKVTRGLEKILSSESESSRDTFRRPPSNRRKNASKVMMEDWNSEEISSSTSTTCSYEEAPKPDDNETETINGFGNVTVGNNLSFVACGQSQENENLLEDDKNSDNISIIDNDNSSHSEEVLSARRKLTALKNAMVVLTRLEDLGDFTEDTTGDDIEFKTIDGDFTFEDNSSPTPDPLEIIDDDKNELRENATVNISTGAARVSPRKTVTGVSIGLSPDRRSQVTMDSGIKMTPDFENGSLQKSTESDMNIPLVLDNTSQNCVELHAMSVVGVTENVFTDANSNRRGILSVHKCFTCRSIFDDAETLNKHKKSQCKAVFSCNSCHKRYSTLVQFTKHRAYCSSKGHQKSSTSTGSTNSKDILNSTKSKTGEAKKSSRKASQKKPQTQKVDAKKSRTKNRSRVDNLVCGVCSINFPTPQALSEHIFKHNTEELQEAYRVAKAKAMEDSEASNMDAEQQNPSASEKPTTERNAMLEDNTNNDLLQKSITEVARAVAKKVTSRDALQAKAATVCLCHRDLQPARPDKTDLQIEMVLLCQHCSVVFRRRECFEIHYRKSPQCANDRTRGRLPRLYCANCQSTLNNWAAMRRHLEVHASLNVDGTVRFVCNICRVVFVGFGALFYNHWSSHLKDSMFVASRHSFPRTSVQPIEEIPKLPIGASPDETYILVAEHVCSNCKKLFSTRRDLELHEKNDKCINTRDKPTGQKELEAGWYCDICQIYFTGRDELNQHGKTVHGQLFLCIAASPTNLAFTCTRCFAMKRTIKDIEDHWRNQPEHDEPLSFIELMDRAKGTNDELAKETGNGNDLATKSLVNILKNSTSLRKNQRDDAIVIDIAEESLLANVRNLQPVSKLPETRAICENNQESKGQKSRRKKKDEKRTRRRALEDPSVNIMPSGVPDTEMPMNLVIEESSPSAVTANEQQRTTDSFELVISEISSGRHMFKRTGQTRASGKNLNESPLPAEKITDDEFYAKSSNATIVSTSKSTDELNKNNGSSRTHTVIRNLYSKGPQIENVDTIKYSEANKTARAIVDWLKSPTVSPEIIDIADEAVSAEERPSASPQTVGEKNTLRKDNKTALFVLKKPVVPQSNSNPICPSMIVESCCKTLDKSERSKSCDSRFFVLDTSEMSFEEIRLQDIETSKQLPNEDATGAPKSGFLRVKNLSELQAVKKYNCGVCNAAFESLTSLQEHEQIHVCTPLGNDTHFSKGMIAALVLPDNPTDLSQLQAVESYNCGICNTVLDSRTSLQEHQKIHMQASLNKDIQYPTGITGTVVLPDNPIVTASQQLPTIFATGNVTQQLIGLNSGLGVISSVPVPNLILNNETTGSWFTVTSQNDPPSSVAVVNPNHTLSGGTLLMNLGNQQTVNSNTSSIMTTAVATPNATIAQNQDIITVQQQQQQPLQQQPLQQQQQQQHHQSSTMMGINQSVRDNSGGQIGFHMLPAAVVQPTTQLPIKQQYTNSSQRNSNTVNLPTNRHLVNAPFTYHSDMPNRYLCNICTTFRCNSIGTMNTHVMKHYTGFNTTTTRQNPTQTVATVASPNAPTPFLGTNEACPTNMNVMQDQVRNNWFVKHTTQGPVWMASPPNTMNQQSGSSSQHNNHYQAGASMPHRNNSTGTYVRGGQLLYRCLICKSAMYKSLQPLQDHVILVHKMLDSFSRRIENIIQKIYLCTICPNGTVMYDSEEGLCRHIYSCHSNTCFTCRRTFNSNVNLKAHLGVCTASSRYTDNNC